MKQRGERYAGIAKASMINACHLRNVNNSLGKKTTYACNEIWSISAVVSYKVYKVLLQLLHNRADPWRMVSACLNADHDSGTTSRCQVIYSSESRARSMLNGHPNWSSLGSLDMFPVNKCHFPPSKRASSWRISLLSLATNPRTSFHRIGFTSLHHAVCLWQVILHFDTTRPSPLVVCDIRTGIGTRSARMCALLTMLGDHARCLGWWTANMRWARKVQTARGWGSIRIVGVCDHRWYVLIQGCVWSEWCILLSIAEQRIHLTKNFHELTMSTAIRDLQIRWLTSRKRNTECVIPMLDFTFDCGRSISGGGWGGDFICFCFFLFISGDAFPSVMFTAFHSLVHSWTGRAASMNRFLGRYSSWPVVTNSNNSIFCWWSKCAFRVPVAIN